MMGGEDAFTAAAGQLSHLSVFNNATQGEHLYIVAFDVTLGANNGINIETGGGSFGQTPSATAAAPLLANGPLLPGIMGHFQSAACVGSHIGGTGRADILNATWRHDFPCAIIPPNYSFILETQAAAVTIVGGIWWQVLPRP